MDYPQQPSVSFVLGQNKDREFVLQINRNLVEKGTQKSISEQPKRASPWVFSDQSIGILQDGMGN